MTKKLSRIEQLRDFGETLRRWGTSMDVSYAQIVEGAANDLEHIALDRDHWERMARTPAEGDPLVATLAEIERLQRRVTEAAILFAPLAEHDQAVREWLEETP
jgi:hypothetical protein